MSALGQKQTCAAQQVMSALPPKADICGAIGMSALCQKPTSCCSLDQLVGSQHEPGGNLMTNCLRRLEIEDQFKLGGLLDWDFARRGSAQNLGHLPCQLPVKLQQAWPISG